MVVPAIGSRIKSIDTAPIQSKYNNHEKVGMTGQSSNLFLEDLATIKNFLEKNKTLLDIIEEPF